MGGLASLGNVNSPPGDPERYPTEILTATPPSCTYRRLG